MIDPNIALSVNTPPAPASPIATFGQLLQIRDTASQVQLRQAQTEHARQQAAEQQAITDQRRRDFQDQQTIQTHMADPANAKMVGAGDLSGLYGKVTPTALFGLQKQITEAQKNVEGLDAETLKNNVTRHGVFEQTLDGLMQLPVDQRPQAYQGAIQSLQSSGLLKGINIPPEVDFSDDGLKKLASINSVAAGLYDKALARKKEQTGIAQTEAQTAQTEATTGKTEQETAIAAKRDASSVLAASAEQGPEAYQAALAALPPEMQAHFQGVANPEHIRFLGMSPDEQIKAIQAKAELARQQALQVETARHNRAEEGLSGGRLAIEGQKNAREEKIYQQTYGDGANPALQGVEPKLRTQAAGAAAKVLAENAQAKAAADEMKTVIDLARAGNKTAYAYAPVTGVLTINSANGTKRINMAEIKQYEGAGSLVDRVTGYLGKQVSGASIPPNILNDMEQLHTSLGKAADKSAQTKLEGVNQTYRSNFTLPAPPKSGTIRARDPQGVLHEAPAGTALPKGWKLE